MCIILKYPFPERRRSFEITSFVETQGTSLLKEFPVEFVKYPCCDAHKYFGDIDCRQW